MSTVTQLRAALMTAAAYRNIIKLPLMGRLLDCLKAAEECRGEDALTAYCDVYYMLGEAECASLAEFLSQHLHYDTAPYAQLASTGQAAEQQTAAARRDIFLFRTLAGMTGEDWKALLAPVVSPKWKGILENLPTWEGVEDPFTLESLTRFYQTHGSGLFSKYRAFLWQEGKLNPVENPDFIHPDDLVGYKFQRDQVYANTAALVAGKRVNNVLLYGESGTGKSATVKSLLGIPEFASLRLIEVDKSDLPGIPDLIRLLGHRPQKFILYIDDLAFDKDDKTYSLLKTILEGGLEPKPANVAIYATSNRRHLVRETFSDRAGDEVDATETIAEKTSLSERFGLRIPYLALNMAYQLATAAGLSMTKDEMRPAAIRWIMRHPGRTPRVAQQFVHSLIAME